MIYCGYFPLDRVISVGLGWNRLVGYWLELKHVVAKGRLLAGIKICKSELSVVQSMIGVELDLKHI
jgi:hypothetical protein